MVPDTNERRIVVGVDGSDDSLKALDWAAGQAELTGASVEIVSTWTAWPWVSACFLARMRACGPMKKAPQLEQVALTAVIGMEAGLELGRADLCAT